jgi:hypothetical protein
MSAAGAGEDSSTALALISDPECRVVGRFARTVRRGRSGGVGGVRIAPVGEKYLWAGYLRHGAHPGTGAGTPGTCGQRSAIGRQERRRRVPSFRASQVRRREDRDAGGQSTRSARASGKATLASVQPPSPQWSPSPHEVLAFALGRERAEPIADPPLGDPEPGQIASVPTVRTIPTTLVSTWCSATNAWIGFARKEKSAVSAPRVLTRSWRRTVEADALTRRAGVNARPADRRERSRPSSQQVPRRRETSRPRNGGAIISGGGMLVLRRSQWPPGPKVAYGCLGRGSW